MLKSCKADVLLQYVFTVLAILIATIVGSVIWIKGFNSQFAIMEDTVKQAHREDLSFQQPLSIVGGETADD